MTKLFNYPMPMPMPIYIRHGHSHPITESQVKFFIGCLIVLTMIYLVLVIVYAIKYKKYKKNEGYKMWDNFYEYFFYNGLVINGLLSIILGTIYSLILIALLGSIVAKLL